MYGLLHNILATDASSEKSMCPKHAICTVWGIINMTLQYQFYVLHIIYPIIVYHSKSYYVQNP